MKYNLLTTYYLAEDQVRNEENAKCLQMNQLNPLIEKIYFFLQSSEEPNFKNTDKIEFVHLGKRPRFRDFFDFTNSRVEDDVCFVVANSDIYFDLTLTKLSNSIDGETLFTLTRWDLQKDGSLSFFNKYLSQDTWIYNRKIENNIGDYFIGQHGCDNRLLFELYENNIRVENPAYSVRSIHVHMSQLRPYFNNPNYQLVEPPYGFSLPKFISPGDMLKGMVGNTRTTFKLLMLYRQVRYEYFKKSYLGTLEKQGDIGQKYAKPLALLKYLFNFNFLRVNLSKFHFENKA